jgi:hypothetical protein
LLHVLSVSVVLSVIGQVRPPLLTGLVTLYILVLVPSLGAVALTPSQVAAQAVQVPQSPTQSTEQSVLLHVESVSSVLSDIGQIVPPLLTGLVTLYILVLVPVPILVLALTPSQVAAQAVQVPQSPTQLTEQSVLLHVLSVSSVLSDILQIVPPLLTGLVTLYVLVLVPVPILDVAFIPSQVAAQAVQLSQSPTQLTEQSVLLHVESVSVVLSVIGQIAPPLRTALVTLYVRVLVPVLGAVALTLSQVATQAFHTPQSPMQLTEQSVLLHVLSVSIVLSAIGQVRPLLIATVLTL